MEKQSEPQNRSNLIGEKVILIKGALAGQQYIVTGFTANGSFVLYKTADGNWWEKEYLRVIEKEKPNGKRGDKRL